MRRSGSITGSKADGWSFVVDIPGPDGKRKQHRRRGFATKGDAQQALNTVLTEIQTGTFTAPDKLTVEKYLADWVSGLPVRGLKPSTYTDYAKKLKHITSRLGNLELQKLRATHLDALYAELLTSGRRNGKGGLSPRTVRYAHSVLSKALSDAERAGLVARNVARLASPPSASSTRPPEQEIWTPAELALFLDHHHGHELFAVFRLIGFTGLRRGEAAALEWASIDLDKGLLTVRVSATVADRQVFIGPPKSKRSRRTIDLDTETLSVLRDHRRRQTERRLMLGQGWTDEGLVFDDGTGGMINPDRLTRVFDQSIRRVEGLKRIRLHDLRHSHATHLLAAGVNVKLVADRLGHSTTSFTLDVYGHVLPGQQRDAAEAVARLVAGS